MRLGSDALCWLRRASRDGSCRLVIQNGAGAPEAAARSRQHHRFFHLASAAITWSISPLVMPSLTSFRRATVSSHASGLSETASLGHVSSAVRLLCSGDLSWVKECANSDCGAFFSDTSKNCGRRWCATTGRGVAFGSPRSTNAGATNLAQGLKPGPGEGPLPLLESLKAD